MIVVVKFWPHPRWRHMSLTFQLSEVYQSSPKSMMCPISSRSSPLPGFLCSEDFNSKPSSSSNSSLFISTDGYATIYVFTFITCNVIQRRQSWIVNDFPACNTKPAPLIAGRCNKMTCANCAVTKISLAPPIQLSTSEPRLPTKRTSGHSIIAQLWDTQHIRVIPVTWEL